MVFYYKVKYMGIRKVKSNKEEFIEKAKLVHGDRYDYSLWEYVDCKTKSNIICKEHGVFKQNANNHLQGKGCPFCGGRAKRTTEDFVKKAKELYGDKYDYSLVEYINCETKIKIICNTCKKNFLQNPNNHLRGRGCPICRGFYRTTEDFIEKSNKIHDNKYDYSLTEYINSEIEVIIICPEHGKFKQIPYLHIYGTGCPYCKSSRGEKIIRNFLKENNIMYEEQKKFKDCKNKLPLSFDFYLTEYNVCIEYQGIQHFKPVEHFGGVDAFIKQKERDKIKKEYCKNNNIPLIEITYNNKNLSEIKALLLKH